MLIPVQELGRVHGNDERISIENIRRATRLTLEILNEVVFNQVLAACADDAQTDETIKLIQQSGECWVGGTQWHQRHVIRISVCSWATTEADVSRSVKAFVEARRQAQNT